MVLNVHYILRIDVEYFIEAFNGLNNIPNLTNKNLVCVICKVCIQVYVCACQYQGHPKMKTKVLRGDVG